MCVCVGGGGVGGGGGAHYVNAGKNLISLVIKHKKLLLLCKSFNKRYL